MIADFLFPVRCPVCDKPVAFHRRREGICKNCFAKLPIIEDNRCCKCGRQLFGKEKEWCQDCIRRAGTHAYERGFALCSYDDSMRESIYRMKYGGRMEYGMFYGRLMALRFGNVIRRAGVDGIVPVPLHPRREFERGYNQAAVLAEALGRMTGIPVYEDLILRVCHTKPLKSMTAVERQNNLKKAFKIGRNDVKLKVIIIVDDIYTTGSTIDAVARVLMETGIRHVYFVTLAIGEDI